MKTLRIVMLLSAIVIAVGGALSTTANGKLLVDQAWGKTNAQSCAQGAMYNIVVPASGNISDCSGGAGTCKVQIGLSQFDAYQNQTQCSASNPLKYPTH